MKKSDFEYELPEYLIAQSPPEHRQSARLMVVDRSRQTIEHKTFSDFLTYLSPSDLDGDSLLTGSVNYQASACNKQDLCLETRSASGTARHPDSKEL